MVWNRLAGGAAALIAYSNPTSIDEAVSLCLQEHVVEHKQITDVPSLPIAVIEVLSEP